VTWVFHGEKYTSIVVEESTNDQAGADRMDEMLEAIWPEFDMDTENPPTPEVDEFFNLLKASEELLQGHTKVTMLAFMIRLMAIKSKFFFSNNYYNELLKLFGISFRILISYLKTCTIPKNLSMSPVWIMRRLMSIEIVVCFFWKEHKDENTMFEMW
jgi:hypothetical protein